MPSDSTKIIAHLLADPAVSFWLKNAITDLLKRDSLDAAKDSKILYAVMKLRINEIMDKDLN